MHRLATRLFSSIRTTAPRLTTTTTTPRLTPITTRTMATSASTAYLDALKARRTIYALNKDLGAVPASRVQAIASEALQHVPSSFNSQSNRVVVLLGAEHDKFWDITASILKAIVPEAAWEATGSKMAMFKAAAGSILFFEDQTVVEGMQAKFAAYADRFPVWATQSSGMLQHAVWTMLELEGLGANLQHYNPLVDAKVAETWGLPATWKLSAQLVFGGRVAEAGEKTFTPLEDKFKVFGA